MNEKVFYLLAVAQMTIALTRAAHAGGYRLQGFNSPSPTLVPEAVASTAQYLGDALKEFGDYSDPALYKDKRIITAAWQQAEQLEIGK